MLSLYFVYFNMGWIHAYLCVFARLWTENTPTWVQGGSPGGVGAEPREETFGDLPSISLISRENGQPHMCHNSGEIAS